MDLKIFEKSEMLKILGEYVNLGPCPATNSFYNVEQIVAPWESSVFKSVEWGQQSVSGQGNYPGVFSLRLAPSLSSFLYLNTSPHGQAVALDDRYVSS